MIFDDKEKELLGQWISNIDFSGVEVPIVAQIGNKIENNDEFTKDELINLGKILSRATIKGYNIYQFLNIVNKVSNELKERFPDAVIPNDVNINDSNQTAQDQPQDQPQNQSAINSAQN